MTSIRPGSALLLLALAGCTSAPHDIVRPVTLPLPARPTLTPVKGASLQCLATDAYSALVKRERALESWGEQMEAVIKANNEAARGSGS